MHSRKFTLVELLIVIGIIAILAGILLPVINGASKRADMTKAKAEMTTLINAIKQFESTYGHLPLPTGYAETTALTGTQYKDLIWMLQAEENDKTNADEKYKYTSYSNSNPNTRKTRFLDVVGNKSGQFQDPWGNNYNIIMDEDYDGKIVTGTSTDITSSIIPCGCPGTTTVYFESTSTSPLYYSIIIWSAGANDSDNSVNSIRNDNVYSFPVSWDKTAGKYNITQ